MWRVYCRLKKPLHLPSLLEGFNVKPPPLVLFISSHPSLNSLWCDLALIFNAFIFGSDFYLLMGAITLMLVFSFNMYA